MEDGVEVLRIFVEDLSVHGTFVNGNRIAHGDPFELTDRDCIMLGTYDPDKQKMVLIPYWRVRMRKMRKRRSTSDREAAANTSKRESVGGDAESSDEDDDIVGAVEVTASELEYLVGNAGVRWEERTEEEVAARVANRANWVRYDGVIWDRMVW
ncbi:hypothetical protein HK101_010858 [Irineochytrium annulatum]|nr:hypothetical protein HK101_010858 [Irineochytrium annulatum]